jgi:hypothetical protein
MERNLENYSIMEFEGDDYILEPHRRQTANNLVDNSGCDYEADMEEGDSVPDLHLQLAENAVPEKKKFVLVNMLLDPVFYSSINETF